MTNALFFDLAIVLSLTVVVSFLMKLLRQPLIIGYILVGIILGPYAFNVIDSNELFEVFSKIGIALLLFVVGLNLSPSSVKGLGKVSLVTGLGQILFTSVIGYLISLALGFSVVESLYIAIALTFSSTVIIMKLLSDKNELNSLHGRISIGFLIIQDIVAVLILMALSSFGNEQSFNFNGIFWTMVLGLTLLVALFLVSKYVLPVIIKGIAKSQELLMLFAIGWCLIISYLFFYLDFSLEIGALLSGLALSYSEFRLEIASRLKPLRDFFIVLFFIVLGSQMILTDVGSYLPAIIILSLFILIGNPLIVVILMGLLGYKKRSAFLSGLTVAQISEFSLILVMLGLQIGHLSQEVVSLVTYICIITIAGSSYFIVYSEKIYPYLAKVLSIFERKGGKLDRLSHVRLKSPEIVLFGYNRIGKELIKTLHKNSEKVLVIDYDPEVVQKLTEEGHECVYGDASDLELLREIDFSKLKMAISTIDQIDTNLLLVEKIKSSNKSAIFIINSQQIDDAVRLYDSGATYVVLPHLIGGHYVSSIIEKHSFDKEKFEIEKTTHLKYLNKKLAQ